MARWRAERPGLDIVLRVNMSPTELAVPGFVGRVQACLEETGLPGEALCLEITENAAIMNVEQTVQMLREIRSLGVQLAIDDFGSGYSSMTQLKNLPVNVLKIDRVFVDGVATDPINQGIVESIVRIGTAFELQIVAEGIEEPADLEDARAPGVPQEPGVPPGPPAPGGRGGALLRGGHGGLPRPAGPPGPGGRHAATGDPRAAPHSAGGARPVLTGPPGPDRAARRRRVPPAHAGGAGWSP